MNVEKTHCSTETLKSQVEKNTGVSVNTCYQCGKCTAGCPLNEDMDYMPHQILRMLQSQLAQHENRVLGSLSIWLCLACDTCYSRCPQEIPLSKIMDFLRQESMRQRKVNPKAQDIVDFHQSFLHSIKAYGKLYEVGLTIDYKLHSHHLTQDVNHVPQMLSKDKLAFFPHKVHNTKAIANIFNRIAHKYPKMQ